MGRRRLIAATTAISFSLLALAFRPTLAAPAVEITDLGAVPGFDYQVFAVAVNNSRQVAGVSNGGDGTTRSFRWSSGNLQILADINAVAGGMSDLGDVVGEVEIATGWRLFHRHDGTFTILSPPFGLAGGEANDVNNRRLVVGRAPHPDGTEHGFLYSDERGTFNDLGPHFLATAINDDGVLVGFCSVPQCSGRSYLRRGKLTQDIGSLGGGETLAVAINENGQVVGRSRTASGELHAFIRRQGAMVDLGTLRGFRESFAEGINNCGQAVGILRGDSDRAFVYSGGIMSDLNRKLPAGSRWTLLNAFSINDAGTIVGAGLRDGLPRAFMLRGAITGCRSDEAPTKSRPACQDNHFRPDCEPGPVVQCGHLTYVGRSVCPTIRAFPPDRNPGRSEPERRVGDLPAVWQRRTSLLCLA